MAPKKARSKASYEDSEEEQEDKRQRVDPNDLPITQRMLLANPRTPHPRDIDQPTDHHFDFVDLGAKREGENFDKFDITAHVRRRGGATCNSVLVMKHNKPLPMWFDVYMCPRVMPGKWCGYVAYAFRRRILIGTWRTWHDVPDDVKEEAWNDILASWDFRTALNAGEHADLKKIWTSYAADRIRNWRTQVFRRYIRKPKKNSNLGHPTLKYKWLAPKEWDLFVSYRTSEEFDKLSKAGIASSEYKEFYFQGGSGGYRKIILDKGKERMQEVENKKVNKGMPRAQAMKEALEMNIYNDRSIVLVEGNRCKKTGKIVQDWVRDLEPKILQMNKDKEAGKLSFTGKEDILTRVTKKIDHSGCYRGCPGTARTQQAMPEYYAEKMRKRAAYRKPAKPVEGDIIKMDRETFASYIEWVKEQSASGNDGPTSLDAFYKHRERLEEAGAAGLKDEGPGDSDDESTTACFLNIEDSTGQKRRAAAGLIITRPAHLPYQHASQYVQVRPPIVLPQAKLPFYDAHYKSVGSAVGANVDWPDTLIEYEDEIIPKKSEEPNKKVLDQESSDDDDLLDSEEDDEDEDTDSSESDEPKRMTAIPASIPPPTVDWEFAHHVVDTKIRTEYMEFLAEVNKHPGGRILFKFDVGPEVFGTLCHKTFIDISQAMDWIISCNTGRKDWIHNWQMDMWMSFLHTQMKEGDCGRVQFVSTNSSFSGNTDPAAAKAAFVDHMTALMKERPARIYVAPFHRVDHWRALFIVPELSIVYCIDSSYSGITPADTPFEHDMLMSFGAAYDATIRPGRNYDHQKLDWKIINLRHKVQPNLWECGYYTMLYIEKLVLLNDGVNVEQVFAHDTKPYPVHVIEGLVDSFCRHSMELIADDVKRQIMAKQKKTASLKALSSSGPSH